MDVLKFFVCALIVLLMAYLFGGSLVSYYFLKKKEYDREKLAANLDALKQGLEARKKGVSGGHSRGSDGCVRPDEDDFRARNYDSEAL